MTAPVILVGGNLPRPNGTEGNSTFALNTASVALSLQSISNIGSVTWALASKPIDSMAAIASASPTTPFSTTLGPLDKAGTYLFSVTTDAGETDEVAITVLTANAGLRKPAETETTQWSLVNWWSKSISDLFDKVDELAGLVGTIGNTVTSVNIATGTHTLSASQMNSRFIKYVGSDFFGLDSRFLDGVTGWWILRNESNQTVTAKTVSGVATVPIASGESRIAWSDGTELYSGHV